MNILKLPHDWNDNYYQVSKKAKEQIKMKKLKEKSKKKNYEIEF